MEEQEGKKKEHLVAYSVRLKRDQVEFLKNQKDAAAFIREILDAAILACSAKSKEHEAVLLNRRIRLLQKQIERIRESEEYKDIIARWDSDDMSKFRWALLDYKTVKPLMHDVKNLKVEPPKADPEMKIYYVYKVYHPSNPAACITLGADEGVYTPGEALQRVIRDINNARIVEQNLEMKSEYEFLEKTKQSYDEEIARLEKEIQELKNKIIVIQ